MAPARSTSNAAENRRKLISCFTLLRAKEKSFYEILKALAHKYDFEYPEDKLIKLAKELKTVVDDKAKHTDWSQRAE